MGPMTNTKLFYNLAQSMEDCLNSLKESGLPLTAPSESETWCNATWDSVLCWPATQANASAKLPCPPLKGLDPTKILYKVCDVSGYWKGKDAKHPSQEGPGWTDFSLCFTPKVKGIVKSLTHEQMEIAQKIARGARKLEFVGLGLSFVSLLIAVIIFMSFRRLRVFRNQIHLHLMLALLGVVTARLILYIDLIFTERLGSLQTTDVAATINTMRIACEGFYFVLEYFKTAEFAWMFMEGFYLHNSIVVSVFSSEPKLWRYLLFGYLMPLIHTAIWLLVVIIKSNYNVERCLGSYYLQVEFWVMDGPRMAELVLNTLFLLNIVRVLWLKVKETHSSTDSEQFKKSVKASLMLIVLLGVPNIMQTIPFTPNMHNITFFGVYTYCASFFHMYQGFFVAILYCFTNREVINVLKSRWQRYRLQYSTVEGLRRGSRQPSLYPASGASNGKAPPLAKQNSGSRLWDRAKAKLAFYGTNTGGAATNAGKIDLTVHNDLHNGPSARPRDAMLAGTETRCYSNSGEGFAPLTVISEFELTMPRDVQLELTPLVHLNNCDQIQNESDSSCNKLSPQYEDSVHL